MSADPHRTHRNQQTTAGHDPAVADGNQRPDPFTDNNLPDYNELLLGKGAARAEHQAAVARGEVRIVCRGRDRRWHSYRPEEYGARSGGRIRLTSVAGHLAWTGVWGFAVLIVGGACLLAFLRGEFPEPRGNDWPGLLFLGLTLGALCLFFVLALRDPRKEIKAARLRKQRGLPRPID